MCVCVRVCVCVWKFVLLEEGFAVHIKVWLYGETRRG